MQESGRVYQQSSISRITQNSMHKPYFYLTFFFFHSLGFFFFVFLFNFFSFPYIICCLSIPPIYTLLLPFASGYFLIWTVNKPFTLLVEPGIHLCWILMGTLDSATYWTYSVKKPQLFLKISLSFHFYFLTTLVDWFIYSPSIRPSATNTCLILFSLS